MIEVGLGSRLNVVCLYTLDPGGFVGVASRMLCRADCGQVLGAVGKLPEIYTGEVLLANTLRPTDLFLIAA